MKHCILFTFLISFSAFSQQAKQDSTLFDFWVGEWDLTWKDPDGSTATGKNIITKILDGKVIHEDFIALTGQSKGFKGESFSILENRTGTWKQTWVDNQNSFLSFTGGSGDNGKTRFFSQEFTNRKGALVKQKMVFRDITNRSFVWDWMNSSDSGKTWNTGWSIDYKRKK